MITRTILASVAVVLAMAVTPAAAAPATNTAQATDAQLHLAGFKHVKKHHRVGRYGRFVNRGFRTRHFGHRGFYRGSALGYYLGLRKHLHEKKSGRNSNLVTDRYGNPITIFRNGKALETR